MSGGNNMKMQTLKVLAITAALAAPTLVLAQDQHSHETPQPPKLSWSFAGWFGKYDQAQLQRGLKVYKEVCAACHSTVSYTHLTLPTNREV